MSRMSGDRLDPVQIQGEPAGWAPTGGRFHVHALLLSGCIVPVHTACSFSVIVLLNCMLHG